MPNQRHLPQDACDCVLTPERGVRVCEPVTRIGRAGLEYRGGGVPLTPSAPCLLDQNHGVLSVSSARNLRLRSRPPQNERETLKQCYLVSKSWALCARKSLFAMVRFRSPTDPAAWMRMFSDPAKSSGYLVRSLHVACVDDFSEAIAGNCDWFRSFSNVVQLEI